jgi:hypothetical protein
MDPYVTTLYEIVTRGRNTNSYKFALWRALARLAPDTGTRRPTISKRDISPLFVGYYWPLEIKYHIRQSIDPDKDPIVMKLIRQLVKNNAVVEGETITDFQKRRPQEYQALIDKVARRAFDDVIPRFHIVHDEPIHTVIYEFSGRVGDVDDTIQLTKGGRQSITRSLLITLPRQVGFDLQRASLRLHGFTTKSMVPICEGERSHDGNLPSWRSKTEDAFTTRATT